MFKGVQKTTADNIHTLLLSWQNLVCSFLFPECSFYFLIVSGVKLMFVFYRSAEN